jgi:hypothetical protein
MNVLGLRSSVYYIIISFGTEEYSIFIFLGTEEYKKIKECNLFSCSEMYPFDSSAICCSLGLSTVVFFFRIIL